MMRTAAEVEIGRATLYKYFSSVDEILGRSTSARSGHISTSFGPSLTARRRPWRG